MEKVLEKIARQLSAFDEASLMNLWEKYAARVANFEPSRRWEEAVIILGIIQSVRFKNQLFNHHWASGRKPVDDTLLGDILPPEGEEPSETSDAGPSGRPGSGKRGKLLRFTPPDDG